MNYIHRDENAIYYECGYSCDNALYLKLGDSAYFLTDGRYSIEAKASVQGAEVIITADLYDTGRKLIKKSKIKTLTYDPKEWDIFAFERLSRKLSTRFKPKPDLTFTKRIVKRPDEIAKLTKAVALGAKAFDRFSTMIKKKGFGKDEFALTYMAQGILSDKGRYELSFSPIVAIGANAAKPHAVATDTRLHEGDLLLVDAGLKYERYCSDRTRSVYVDSNFTFDYPQRFRSKKIQKAYDTVLKAHDKAIKKARSGMKARKIDALAREVIEKAGFGEYFVHSTGHGVGLDIHEPPYISWRSDTKIEDGMVFTIEPGIYIPGEFGIRIEDMVVMRGGCAEVLG